jgi:hypothetical protein
VADTIRYRNTDLDLASSDDLKELAASFKAFGVPPTHVTLGGDGQWYATFNTEEYHDQPEPNIAAIVTVVESLEEPIRAIWRRCTRREFNLGYDCGARPWAFNQGLSSSLLGRIAALGADLRFTLYPTVRAENADDVSAETSH